MTSRRLVRIYYGFTFFFTMLFWLPVFYEFQKRIGLSDSQIFGIQGLYSVLFVLLEIPTGLFADVLGRRASILAGAGTLVVANLLPVLAPGASQTAAFALMLVHFFGVAVARSFVSGAASAYVYDLLEREGRASTYKEVEGNARAISLAGKVVFWIGVGAMMEWHLALPYWLTAGSALLAFVVAWMLPAEAPATGHSDSRSRRFVTELGGALRVLAVSPFLIWVIVQGLFLFVVGRVVEVNLFQPLLQEKAVPLAWHGGVLSLMTVFEALCSSQGAQRRLERFGNLNAVFGTTALLALSILPMAFGGMSGVLLGLCVAAIAMGLAYPAQKQLLNDAIPDSRYRATLNSIESMFDRTVTALVVTGMGAYLERARADGSVVLGLRPVSGFLLWNSIATVAGLILLGLSLGALPALRARARVTR